MATVPHSSKTTGESPKSTYSFTLLLSGVDQINEAVEQALFAVGCDDALLGVSNGQPFLDFDREADSLQDAIRSAIEDVERNDLGIRVVRVAAPGEQTISLFNLVLSLRSDKQGNVELVEDMLRRLAK